ncbi:CLUMA_CG003783, isoform A [Clunio marinus]|uniref:CLUMA_CG003783, isoform A n=1 Tax=Clunio marinus TaxID=568069 RepID=A0A1J1HPT0_9DIPT|nr:CLUMA_CG003783, isoform A [Clunio marinus]
MKIMRKLIIFACSQHVSTPDIMTSKNKRNKTKSKRTKAMLMQLADDILYMKPNQLFFVLQTKTTHSRLRNENQSHFNDYGERKTSVFNLFIKLNLSNKQNKFLFPLSANKATLDYALPLYKVLSHK